MASFMEDLWNSIFTPGPTSTLLLATNATFAGLQVLLAALLLTTYSIHFAILSFLCGGLWYAINWFANEIREVQAREEEIKRRNASQHDSGDAAGTSMDSGDDTETELDQSKRSLTGSANTSAKGASSTSDGLEAQSSGLVHPTPDEDAVRKRRSMADSSGDISTDSEWEKVEGE